MVIFACTNESEQEQMIFTLQMRGENIYSTQMEGNDIAICLFSRFNEK
jgi:secreted trypsin-like serine protease